MANVKFSSIVADARGAVGGVVFGRGGGGAIARTNVKPTNPRSSRQSACRAVLAQLTQYWSAKLIESERIAWRAYAAGTSWTNKVGTSASISGLAAFVRLNTLLVQAGLAIEKDAPTMTGHAGQPSFTFTANPTSGTCLIAEPSLPFEKAVTDSRLLLYIHTPTNAGRLRPSGNKRYLQLIAGNLGAPPTFPVAANSPFPYLAGQNVSITGIFIDQYGRIGGDFTKTVVAAVP